MRTIVKDMTLGFSQENETRTISVKQGDSQRKIQFELINENDDYVVQDVTGIYFRERFSDGTSIIPKKVYPLEGNTLSPDGSILTVQLTDLMTDVPGMAYCELMFVKTDGILTIDPVTEEIIGEFDVLTSQTFNLYIEPSVSNNTEIHSGGDTGELLKLIIATQALNNEIREDEDKRLAFEGAGTYALHPEYLEYQENGEIKRIYYQNSRVGASERDRAITFGGHYIDLNGIEKEASNEYEYNGQTYDASNSNLNGLSIIAIGDSTIRAVNEIRDDVISAQNSADDAQNSANTAEHYADIAEIYAEFTIPQFLLEANKLYVSENQTPAWIVQNNRLYVQYDI